MDERLASQPSNWRLIERLASTPNGEALREALGWWTGRHHRVRGRGDKARRGTIDLDPFPTEVRGKQQGCGVARPLQAEDVLPAGGEFQRQRGLRLVAPG